jgi:hypothetical protein
MLKPSFRHPLVAALLLVSMLVQGTWVLAGTTGTLSGNVYEDSAASTPIAGAKVSVTSPSQAATSISDANGHFVFLSLAPDSYTISAEKSGYDPVSVSGVTVQADQNQSVAMRLKRTLTTIGRVTSRASSAIVRPGTTSDVYSVNQSAATAVQSLGGGQNLENAYSAIASVPGVLNGYGSVGWGQTLYIHGSNYGQIGYEFDGVPVNRAFDNYQATTASNLGQQELQVVTSSVAGSSSSTVAGYINQVIKTGTYPGFAGVTLGLGDPAFYHSARFEVGGATPNRNFSYYIGISGYNQDQRYLDQFNGGLEPAGLQPNYPLLPFQQQTLTVGGIFPPCVNGVSPYLLSPGTPGYLKPGTGGPTGCIPLAIPYNGGGVATQADRETVGNIHFGIPHHNDGGKDDIQLLYSGSHLRAQYYTSINDLGGVTAVNQLTGNIPPYVSASGPIGYEDGLTFPASTPFLTPASSVHGIPYLYPSSPQSRTAGSVIDPNVRDGQQNDSQIVKLQYQRNFSPTSYLRAYGYTFYSDWLLNAPAATALEHSMPYGALVFPSARDYELDTHTRGGEIQYANQFNSKNLLTISGNYVTATVLRLNNGTMLSGAGTAATNLTDGTNCYNALDGTLNSCFSGATAGSIGTPIPICGSSSSSVCTPGLPIPIVGAAAAAGAQYRVTFTGYRGTLNQVTPQFSAASITDQFKPNDRLLLNAGLRFENYNYVIPSTTNGQDYAFWFNQAANSYCYDPATNQPVVRGGVTFFNDPSLIVTAPGGPCPASPITGQPTLHPNGQNGAALYTNKVPGTFSRAVLMPRLNGTYTLNPDTVVRFGAGIYSEPFNTATTEYLDLGAKRAANFDFQKFWSYGFNTPEHKFDPSKSYNFDMSLEKHLKGTDMSFKVNPFYRYVKNQYQDYFIGTGFVSAIPTGDETAYGTEFQFQKGDASRNGFAGLLSYTYTHAFFKFHPLANGTTPISQIAGYVDTYNALTAAGNRFGVRGAPCYAAGFGAAANGQFTIPPGFVNAGSTFQMCNPSGGPSNQPTLTPQGLAFVLMASPTSSGVAQAVVNQYFNLAPQGVPNLIGPYPVYQTFPNATESVGLPDANGTIIWPHVFAGYLNYKHDRLAITPNFQAIYGYSGGSGGGGNYGSPLSVLGVDPRSCTTNQSNVPTAPNKGLPNYATGCLFATGQFGALFIPNPLTGHYDGAGQYANPWLLNVNMNIAYELSNKTKVTLVLSNLYNTCFGGTSTPWTTALPPNNVRCGYIPNAGYVSNFYNGASPHDVAANGALPLPTQLQPYQPVTTMLPFQAALQLQFKI